MKNISLEILTLEDNSYHLLVDVVINDIITGKMVVDTGASKTVLDSSLSLEVQEVQQTPYTSGIGGQVDVAFSFIKKILIGTFEISDISLATIDLSAVNAAYEQISEQRILGLLGSDLLLKHKAVIDYSSVSLYLRE